MHTSLVARAIALSCALAATPLSHAFAAGVEGRTRCAVKDPTAAEQTLIEAQLAAVEQGATTALRSSAPVVVPVHFHVITTSAGGGDVSALVPAQLAVLDAAFASSGFSFSLASLQVVPNDAWFFSELGSPEELEMKTALREGGPESLNVYTTNGDVYLGWATFPLYAKRFAEYDGVVLYWATLPGTGFGGAFDPALEPDGFLTYDEGDTGTHEVGHWLGLYHTFQGGCSEPGDRIKDTNAEAEPQFFCVWRDSCTSKKYPGLDPVTNFMDYVDDACMDNFTGQQERRMQKQWKAFRR